LNIILIKIEWYSWGRREMHIEYWWESQKVRDHWEDKDVGG
jgi:hypothetical protein